MLRTIFPRLVSWLPRLARLTITLCSPRKERQKKLQRILGLYTDYGWVLVKQSHVARGWTAIQIQKEVEATLGDRLELADKYEIQKIAEKWESEVDLSQKPVFKKQSNAEAKRLENLQLYMEQLKEEVVGRLPRARTTNSVRNDDDVTGVQAWNYFLTRKYADYKHLLKKEARAKVGLLWRKMYPEEKETYKEEYRALKAQGKDILFGKIVDKDTKLKANKRMQRAKAQGHKKKQQKLEEMAKEAAALQATYIVNDDLHVSLPADCSVSS